MRADLRFHAWSTVVLVALVPVILVAADYDLWLFPLLGVPLVAIQLGSRQAVINEHRGAPRRAHRAAQPRALDALAARRAATGRTRDGGQVGVLIVGLDRFKEINETLGHRAAATSCCRRRGGAWRRSRGPATWSRASAATSSRSSSARSTGRRTAWRVAEEVIAALREPVEVRGVELDIGASVGIACHPEHGRSVDALLRHADVALDKAKTSRRD